MYGQFEAKRCIMLFAIKIWLSLQSTSAVLEQVGGFSFFGGGDVLVNGKFEMFQVCEIVVWLYVDCHSGKSVVA
jgi:hypothetical protein